MISTSTRAPDDSTTTVLCTALTSELCPCRRTQGALLAGKPSAKHLVLAAACPRPLDADQLFDIKTVDLSTGLVGCLPMPYEGVCLIRTSVVAGGRKTVQRIGYALNSLWFRCPSFVQGRLKSARTLSQGLLVKHKAWCMGICCMLSADRYIPQLSLNAEKSMFVSPAWAQGAGGVDWAEWNSSFPSF